MILSLLLQGWGSGSRASPFMTNPYPMLYRLDGRDVPTLPDSLMPEILRACRIVEQRTCYTAWYNVDLKSVIWVIGEDPARGAADQDVLFHKGRYSPIDAEQTCRLLERARQPWKHKQRAVERGKAWHKEQLDKKAAATGSDLGPELKSLIRYNVRKLIDGRHSRPVITVP